MMYIYAYYNYCFHITEYTHLLNGFCDFCFSLLTYIR